jgi:hypothetical protein
VAKMPMMAIAKQPRRTTTMAASLRLEWT